jgi:prepilin-type N-terminal cleavage/methylation domain-containing protein
MHLPRPYPSQRAPRRAFASYAMHRRVAQRGFTLLEMMTVVVMITILASVAIPLATRQLRNRRTQEVAQQIANLYQAARTRAMGRGSAILVRYTPGTPGTFTTLEAQRGPNSTANGVANAACAALPVSSCMTTSWNVPGDQQYRVVATHSWADDDLTVVMNDGEALDICFTPGGRSFSAKTGDPLTPLAQAFTATVGRTGSADLARDVFVLPNGAARLAL